MKLFLVGLGILALVAGLSLFVFFSPSSSSTVPVNPQGEDQIIIGFLMASNSGAIERWIKDRDFFISRAKELGAKVIVFDAGTDADLQMNQAENLILQGVDVLVVVAQDANKASLIVDKAHAAGIKVIAYDRLITNPTLDFYVSFDNVKVGESQAQGVINVVPKGKFAYVGGSESDTNAFLVKEGSFKVLQPLIDSGDVEIVFNEFTEDWKQEVAYTNMKQFLGGGGTVDAVIAANDSTAVGVIKALEEVGLAGTVPVSGQDASLAAVQFIVSGKQTVTIYKPIKELAFKSAEIAVAVARREAVNSNTKIINGIGFTPAYLLDVISVTKENISQTVIKDGFLTQEEIYSNRPVY